MYDYYKILGIPKTASLNDIKKAYRTLAKKYHPDANSEAKEEFTIINEAYQYLIKNHNPINSSEFSSMFASMFKSSSNSVISKRIFTVKLTVREALEGVVKDLNLNIDIPCDKCNILSKSTCPHCKGFGFLNLTKNFNFTFPKECYHGQKFLLKKNIQNLDICLIVGIIPEDNIKVVGKNIYITEKVDLFKIILGETIPIKTPRGIENLKLQENKLFNLNYVLENKGLSGGSLIIKISPSLPKLTDSQKDYLRKISDIL